MATKNLKVLAECVDSRSGKRYKPGEEMWPVPTAAQARRLIAAGCLPDDALDLAIKADEERDVAIEAAELEAQQQAEAHEEARQEANKNPTNPELRDGLALAQAKFAGATTDEERAAAQTEVNEAQQKLSDAEAALKDPAAQQLDAINEDKLFDHTVDQLKAIAKDEEINLGEAKRKDEIVAAIRAARAKKTA